MVARGDREGRGERRERGNTGEIEERKYLIH